MEMQKEDIEKKKKSERILNSFFKIVTVDEKEAREAKRKTLNRTAYRIIIRNGASSFIKFYIERD